jgi:hypothetical protein
MRGICPKLTSVHYESVPHKLPYWRWCCRKPQQQHRLFELQSDRLVAASFTTSYPTCCNNLLLLPHSTLCSHSACATLHPKHSIWQSATLPPDICCMTAPSHSSGDQATYLKVFGRSCANGQVPQSGRLVFGWLESDDTAAADKVDGWQGRQRLCHCAE